MSDMEVVNQNPLFQHKYAKVNPDAEINKNKIIEGCYQPEAAWGLMRLAENYFAQESVEFIINCNHLFLQKAGMTSRLKEMITIKYNGNIKDGMKAIFERHITVGSVKEINISGFMRRKLKKSEYVICASHELLALDKCRYECAGLLFDSIKETVKNIKLNPGLRKVMEADGTPVDEEVLRRLNLQATNVNDFLSSLPTRGRRM